MNMEPGNIEFIPNQLIWTKEKPKLAGWYWHRLYEGSNIDIGMVRFEAHVVPDELLDGFKRWKLSEIREGVMEKNGTDIFLEDLDYQWAGPLEPPA